MLLLPALVIGIGLGYLLFRILDHRAIAIVMAAITLIFVGLGAGYSVVCGLAPRLLRPDRALFRFGRRHQSAALL